MSSKKTKRLAAVLSLLSLMLLCLGLVACTLKTTYKVTLDYNADQGTVALSPQAENNEYEDGTELTVTVTPNEGFALDTFKLSTEDRDATPDNEGKFVFTIHEDTKITVTFKATEPVAEKYSITKNAPENGEIEISPAAGEDGKYEKDAEITVTLKPAQGYEVDTFTVGGADKKGDLNENVYKFNIAADTEINATFKAKQFSVTTTFEAEQGSITLSPETTDNKYAYGTTVIVTVTAEENYEIEAFTVSTDAEAQLDDEGKYTLTVTADAAISATFKATEILVTKITLSENELNLETGRTDGGAHKLTVTIEPEEATNKELEWSVLPAGIVEVEDGTVTPLNTGSAVITVTSKSNPDATAECTVSVQAHSHGFTGETAKFESKDDSKHIATCECGATEEQTHSLKLVPDDTPAEGHHMHCSVCGWSGTSSAHTLSVEVANSTDYHLKKCDCGYSVEEKHTYNADGSTSMLDGITFNEQEHFIECYVCHVHINSKKHSFQYGDLENGTHKVTCSEMIPGTSVNCKYEKTVDCAGTELTHDDKADPNNHYTLCKDCGGKFNQQPHKAEENGKCACGKEMAEHTHQPIADENGYYDGSCSCGDNMFFAVDASGNLSLTATGIPAECKKIRIPSAIKGTVVVNFQKVLQKNKSIESVIIPESITTLPASGFVECENLQSVVILANAKELPALFLNKCPKLSWIVLSQSITSIKSTAFGSASTTTKLASIYYLGSDWNNSVTVEANAAKFIKTQNTKVYVYSNESTDDGWRWDVDKVTPKPWKEE